MIRERMRRMAGVLVLGVAGCATPGGEPPNPADFARVVPGKTTQAEARALLGRPGQGLWLGAERRQAWGYGYPARHGRRVFWLQWSADGTLHSTSDEIDYHSGSYRAP